MSVRFSPDLVYGFLKESNELGMSPLLFAVYMYPRYDISEQSNSKVAKTPNTTQIDRFLTSKRQLIKEMFKFYASRVRTKEFHESVTEVRCCEKLRMLTTLPLG